MDCICILKNFTITQRWASLLKLCYTHVGHTRVWASFFGIDETNIATLYNH